MEMQATLNLNLSDALSPSELRELLAASQEQQKPVERLLFEAAKELIRHRATPPTEPEETRTAA